MAPNTKPSMSLVGYPDSDSDNDEDDDQLDAQSSQRSRGGDPTSSLKRKCEQVELPPLPSAFLDLYSTNARSSTSDDPSLHGGRKRQIPHVEGNWPSHVYLEWTPSQTESDALHKLISAIQTRIESTNKSRSKPLPIPDITPSLLSPLDTPLPLHISLSRTLQIRTEDRTNFLSTLTTELNKSAVKPFAIQFNGLKWVPNFQRNRWFLVLSIARPEHDELNRILHACNTAAIKCGLPALYTGGKGDGPMEHNITSPMSSTSYALNEQRSSSADTDANTRTPTPSSSTTPIVDRTSNFHISIAWNLLEPAPEWLDLIRTIAVDSFIAHSESLFSAVKARIGNTVHNIDLAARKKGGAGKGGLLGLG